MIRLNEHIWIGDSYDERCADLASSGIGAILNVAIDLQGSRGCGSRIDYMQVGLIDGPGNTLGAYYAAVIALTVLIERHSQVLVCCHSGGRAMAISIMYMDFVTGLGWDGCVGAMSERVDAVLPTPHEAHRAAHGKIRWGPIKIILESK